MTSKALSFYLSRRHLLGLGGAVAASVAIGDLAGSNPAQAQDGDVTTISFLYLGGSVKQKQWTELLNEFMRLTPDVKVKAEALPVPSWGEFANQVASRIAAGQPPDIVQVAMAGQRLLVDKDVLEPLDDFIARDKTFVDEYLADVHPALIDGFARYANRGDKTFFLPAEFNTVTMWCNKDVFAAVGVEIPAADASWSWDDFLAAARTIKEKTGAYTISFRPDGYTNSILPWLLSAGTSSMDADWSVPTVNTSEAIEAAVFCRKLVEEGLAPMPGGTFDEATAFARGELAVLGGGRFLQSDLRNLDVDMGKTVQITRWPVLRDSSTPLNWNAYPIMKSSQNKEAAWKLIQFVLSAHAQEYLSELGGATTPSRESVAYGDSFRNGAPKGIDLLYSTLDNCVPVPSPERGPELERAVNEVWVQIMVGNVSPQDGMNNLQNTLLGLV